MAGSIRAATPFNIRRYFVRIEVIGFGIERIIDNSGNVIEPEKLIDINIRYWNAYCPIEGMLNQCIKKYEYEKGRYYDYYTYHKRFQDLHGTTSFIIDLDKDMSIMKAIKASREST